MLLSPLSPGSISLRLYPHDLPAAELVDEMRAQAMLAVSAGFDGVMTSEHHGGFPGYLPNPLQMAGWLLEAMPSGWAAACPLLLPLRPTALVIEEAAWLAARFPGRVGLGVAAGSLIDDFQIMELDKKTAFAGFATALEQVAEALSGREAGLLANDPAVRSCAATPVPMVSAAMSTAAVQRAARLGIGILFDSLSSPDRCKELTIAFRDAGGTGPVVLIRRPWVGDAPEELQRRQVDRYSGYASHAAQAHWGGDQRATGSSAEVAESLRDVMDFVGADALNLRVHVPGLEPAAARAQIEGLADVVTALHA